MRRVPPWACKNYPDHGEVVCPDCLRNYEATGQTRDRAVGLPPRTNFGRGWFSVGATHWFAATDATVFPSRDGKRVLAQAVCGGICDVTLTWAPTAGAECRKCLHAISKARAATASPTPERHADLGGTQRPILRLYRGLKEPYDSARVSGVRHAGTDFTDCPYTALLYATSVKGTLLVLDVPKGEARVSEELWLDRRAKRFMFWGAFDRFIVTQIPAKELRVQVRRKGIVTASDEEKAMVLRRYLRDRRDER